MVYIVLRCYRRVFFSLRSSINNMIFNVGLWCLAAFHKFLLHMTAKALEIRNQHSLQNIYSYWAISREISIINIVAIISLLFTAVVLQFYTAICTVSDSPSNYRRLEQEKCSRELGDSIRKPWWRTLLHKPYEYEVIERNWLIFVKQTRCKGIEIIQPKLSMGIELSHPRLSQIRAAR